MNTFNAIVAREFAQVTGATNITVEFTDDEKIIVNADGKTYVMEIGSDDDAFRFVGPTVVTFGYPADWFQE